MHARSSTLFIQAGFCGLLALARRVGRVEGFAGLTGWVGLRVTVCALVCLSSVCGVWVGPSTSKDRLHWDGGGVWFT